MTFTEIQTAVTDYCLLTSSTATTRVGKAINRHYRRITSQLGLDATRFVTRSVGTTIGLQTVTFDEIEKIDRILDATDATAVRLLDEISIHEQLSTQPNDGEPSSWALQNTDADSVTVLLSTTSAASYTLKASGWTTLSDLSGAAEPVIPESFHDILVWSVIAEELLKKEKDKLAATYTLKAEKLLSDLRFHLADSPTRDTRQGGSSVLALSGSGGGSASIVSTDFIKGGVNVGDYASLAAALTAIGSNQRTLVIHQSTPVTANTTIPQNVATLFTGAGQLVVSATMTLTINGPILAPEIQIFSGAGSFVLPRAGDLYVRWFGAKGDNVADDTAAIQKTVATAHLSKNSNVVFGAGIFRHTQITVSYVPDNAGITFIGTRDASLQQGSTYPQTVLRYTGGASPTFLVSETFTTFQDFATENVGTATAFVQTDADGAGRLHLERITATRAAGTVAYSTAYIVCPDTNYDYIRDCEIVGPAPVFLQITGVSGGTTTVHLIDNVFDQPAANAGGMTVVKIIDGNVELLVIKDNTFNCQASSDGLVVVDATGIGSDVLTNLIYEHNEYDSDASVAATVRVLKLKNCKNAVIDGCTFYGGGVMTALFNLENSYLHIRGCNANGVNGYLVDTSDALSKVFADNCYLDVANVRGILNPSTSAGIAAMTISGTDVYLQGQHGQPGGHTVFTYTAADATARTIQVLDYSDSTQGFMVRGQLVTVWVENTSGGVMGATTFNAADFTLKSTWIDPATGTYATVTFVFNGTKLVEVSRLVPDWFDQSVKIAASPTFVALTLSGGQIAFPAAQAASAGANTLDDYEEGTHTATDQSGAALSLTSVTGNYIKIGQLVTVTINVTYPATADASNAQLSIPFAAGAAGSVIAYGGSMGYSSYGTAMMVYVASGGSTVRFYVAGGTGVTNANLTGATIRFSVTYRASA